MKQPIKRGRKIEGKKPKEKTRLRKPDGKLERVHPKFGTSKLEQDFAEQFLDKLGVNYIYEYFANQIGRYYDFAIIIGDKKNLQFEEKDGLKSVKQTVQITPNNIILIEINGSYWHGDPRIYEEKDLNKTQKKAQIIDEHKKKWALVNGIPIYYIWEKDIRENPSKVMDFLKKILYKTDIIKNKNKRHKNILK